MPHIGPMELAVMLVVVMIIFGVGKLPQVGGAIGKAIREFRSAKAGLDDITKPTETETKEGMKS